MSRERKAGTVAAFCLSTAAGFVLLQVLADVALPSIAGLLWAYGWVGR